MRQRDALGLGMHGGGLKATRGVVFSSNSRPVAEMAVLISGLTVFFDGQRWRAITSLPLMRAVSQPTGLAHSGCRKPWSAVSIATCRRQTCCQGFEEMVTDQAQGVVLRDRLSGLNAWFTWSWLDGLTDRMSVWPRAPAARLLSPHGRSRRQLVAERGQQIGMGTAGR
jgi:hypothetical protein